MSAVTLPTSRTLLVGLLLVIFLAVLIGYPAEIPRDPGITMDEGRGYRATVNLLIERGCLQLDEPAIRQGRRRIAYHAQDGCPALATFEDYRRASPLGGDMAGLVDQRWVIDEGPDGPVLRAIRANSHELRFADDRSLIWQGDVDYADGPATRAGQAGAASWLWVSGADVRSAAPCRDPQMVDGLAPTGQPVLHQYVTCGGRVWQSAEPIGALSETTGSARRVRDPALASVLRRLEVPDMAGSLATTIQRSLQRAMQRRLEAHLDAADTSTKRERTVRAGILLMDGLTGEIGAAATYPLLARHVHDERNLPWRQRNWNFERLPVGSTAKVPFAAAIIQAERRLAGNSPPAGAISTRFCAPGPTGNTCRARAGDKVGGSFTHFITVSSNGHALWLLDQARQSDSTAWQDNLRRFACIEPLTGDGDATCSGYLWRSDQPGAGLHRRGMAEPLVRLDMANQRGETLFAGVYLDILGGNRSSWTSANLAQAYARIFADRAVNPRLTPNDAPAIPRLGVDLPVWRLVRDGMAGVVGDAGTGHALCDAIGCTGNRVGNVWLYAKTGTSTIADVAPNEDGAGGDNGKVLVLLAVRTASNAAPQRPGDITSMKVVIITQRYSAPGRDALDLAANLFCDGQFRAWAGLGRGDVPARCG